MAHVALPHRILKNVVRIIAFTSFTSAVLKIYSDISSKHDFCCSVFNEVWRETEAAKLSSLMEQVLTFYVSRLLKWKPSCRVRQVSTSCDRRASCVYQNSSHSSQQPQRVQVVTRRSWRTEVGLKSCPSPVLWHMVLCCQETLTDFPGFSPHLFAKALGGDQSLFSGGSSSSSLLVRKWKTGVHFLPFPKRTSTHWPTPWHNVPNTRLKDFPQQE